LIKIGSRWTPWRSSIPIDLAFRVSRTATLLYVYLLAEVDETGLYIGVRPLAANIGLSCDELECALRELEDAQYVEIQRPEIVIAQLANGNVILDTGLDVVVKNYLGRPLLCDRLSGEAWARLREIVFERDAYTCQYCGTHGGELECDHVEPISAGGTNELGNLTTACRDCNRAKRARQLDQWRGRASA